MIDSPCGDICTIDSQSGLCIGCSRTQAEIANWFNYSEKQKQKVIIDIKKRNKNC